MLGNSWCDSFDLILIDLMLVQFGVEFRVWGQGVGIWSKGQGWGWGVVIESREFGFQCLIFSV